MQYRCRVALPRGLDPGFLFIFIGPVRLYVLRQSIGNWVGRCAPDSRRIAPHLGHREAEIRNFLPIFAQKDNNGFLKHSV